MIVSTQNNTMVDILDKDLSNAEIFNYIKKINLSNDINFFYLGKKSYVDAWKLQKQLHESVKNNDIPSLVLYLEHDHVYTLGKNANSNFILSNYPKDVQVIQTDRGGQVTYHGPGQLIGYPIINLNNYKKSISWYMRALEQIIILTLQQYDILSSRKDGMTGVWVQDDKICAMGVRLSRWVSMHGFALNIEPDMKYYDGMIPCGIQEFGITSLYELLEEDIDVYEVMDTITQNFFKIFKV
jgi:lipoate-protein ligase B